MIRSIFQSGRNSRTGGGGDDMTGSTRSLLPGREGGQEGGEGSSATSPQPLPRTQSVTVLNHHNNNSKQNSVQVQQSIL